MNEKEVDDLLEEIQGMNLRELIAFTKKESKKQRAEFDIDLLDCYAEDPIQAIYDFIADNLFFDLRPFIHSECENERGI